MKTGKLLYLIIILAVMASCKSKKAAATVKRNEVPTASRIPIAEADPVQKERAYEFGKRILNACNTARFKPFNSSEATASVISNLSESKLTTTCHKFRLKYGDFKDLRLQEIIPNKKDETVVYRYKADYTKKIANKELRVVMNKDNKLVAIKSTDWKDAYKPIQ